MKNTVLNTYGLESEPKQPIESERLMSTSVLPQLINDIQVTDTTKSLRFREKIPVKHHRKMMSMDEARDGQNKYEAQ